MNIHILGLLPDLFDNYFSKSLLGKARAQDLLKFHYHQLWESSPNGRVDDRPYGGGSSMVMMAEYVCKAVRALRAQQPIDRVILTSPRGRPLTPAKARELSQHASILFLCGRFEGIDQRAIDCVVDEEISIGDYVLSGGELAACVIIDAMSRYVPGVVGNHESVQQDSFEDGLLEHSHYTRPEVFEGQAVPPVLLSGDHAKIATWRRREALRMTWQRRPDLLKKAKLTSEELEFIKELIHAAK